MKRTMAMILCTAALVAIAFSSPAANQTLAGKISDSICGPAQAKRYPAPGGSDRQCVRRCLQDGAKYVFVAGPKMYKIKNQGFAGLGELAGQTVYLTGDVKGDTITVSKVAVPDAKGT